MSQHLSESLKPQDLRNLVSNKIHIDEYRSKMGKDEDIVVVSFKVKYKEPATDLVDFVEKAYDFVLDADVSSGEMMDGEYLVFVEIERRSSVVPNIMKMLSELPNLTNIDRGDFVFAYNKQKKYYPCDLNHLSKVIPLSPKQYRDQYGDLKEEIDQFKSMARVKVDSRAPVNEYTERLRIAAGLK
jgi:hypothetical protein